MFDHRVGVLTSVAPGYVQETGLWDQLAQRTKQPMTNATLSNARVNVPTGPRAMQPANKKVQQDELKNLMVTHWGAVLHKVQEASGLYKTLAKSSHAHELLHQSLARYEGSTLKSYLGKVNIFLDFGCIQQLDWKQVDPAFVADFLLEYAQGKKSRKTSPSTGEMLKALHFLSNMAEMAELHSALSANLVQSFRITKAMTRSREAPPMRWELVVDLEAELLTRGNSMEKVLLQGFWLACIWGSLRFPDAMRCKPGELTLQDNVLRGFAWQTKATKKGFPWAVVCHGFLKNPPEQGWGAGVASCRTGMELQAVRTSRFFVAGH